MFPLHSYVDANISKYSSQNLLVCISFISDKFMSNKFFGEGGFQATHISTKGFGYKSL